MPGQAAAEVYERELRIVAAAASVQRFVPLIAEKRARAVLRTRSA